LRQATPHRRGAGRDLSWPGTWRPSLPPFLQKVIIRPFATPLAALLLVGASASQRVLLAQSATSCALPVRESVVDPRTRATHSFVIERSWLTMRDGVRLAATVFRPLARSPSERFPALLELLPYRKDDSFYRRDYPLYSYFACRGFLAVKVDVRGTGGSEGTLPTREYSDAELDDAEEIISQLARRSDTNGSVGMWGISWGGFNAIQVAMRHPPALKAILAMHASDDLFADDVRFIDGVLHIDPYALQIDHENALPRTPDYPLDSTFFAERFDQRPWLLKYLEHPVDGDFWRRGSLRFQYDALQIPAYFIGGLLDGYRDTPMRALERASARVKVEIGPWRHDWPDNGSPGPNYEWRARAVLWWRQWLQGVETGLLAEPRLLVFVRDAVPPNDTLSATPGGWRFVDWPPRGIGQTTWYAGRGGRLLTSPAPDSVLDTLRHVAGAGSAAGIWWGDPTGDMRRDDRDALVFDSPILSDTLRIVGLPRVRLRVRTDMPRAHWSLRLEDVWPDGRVSLVTGRLVNGVLRRDRLMPALLEAEEWFDLDAELHFTTWTYRPGHRVRLAVSHAQFPMAWPSPFLGKSELGLASGATALALPTIDWNATQAASLPASERRDPRPDARDLSSFGPVTRVSRDAKRGTTTIRMETRSSERIGSTTIDYEERETYRANSRTPSVALFEGRERHTIRRPGRTIALVTTITISSSVDSLHVVFRRRISENGRIVREKVWDEQVARGGH
jgi:uncharacterized protein